MRCMKRRDAGLELAGKGKMGINYGKLKDLSGGDCCLFFHPDT